MYSFYSKNNVFFSNRFITRVESLSRWIWGVTSNDPYMWWFDSCGEFGMLRWICYELWCILMYVVHCDMDLKVCGGLQWICEVFWWMWYLWWMCVILRICVAWLWCEYIIVEITVNFTLSYFFLLSKKCLFSATKTRPPKISLSRFRQPTPGRRKLFIFGDLAVAVENQCFK
jgi:hypothetical protein